MQRKLLHIAGLYGVLLATFGALLAGCVDEPTIEPVDKMITPTRFVNCVVDEPGLDIWVDNMKVANNLGFKGVVDYQNINSGLHFVRVVRAGEDTSEAKLRGEVFFRSLTYTSMIVHGLVASTGVGNKIGWNFTQERFTYSDETANLPQDSARIKVINCVLNAAGGKIGQVTLRDTLLADGVPVIRDGDPWVEERIRNIFAPPTTDEEYTTQPNLSAYVKYPIAQYGFSAQFGSLKFFGFRKQLERKYYTFIVTGLIQGATPNATWDVIQLDDTEMWK